MITYDRRASARPTPFCHAGIAAGPSDADSRRIPKDGGHEPGADRNPGLFQLHTQHGQIVKLGRVPDKSGDALGNSGEDLLRRSVLVPVQDVEHSLSGKHPVVLVRGLGHSIGIQKQLVSLFQLDFVIPVLYSLHRADYQAVLCFTELKGAVLPIDRRVFMSRVGGDEPAG